MFDGVLTACLLASPLLLSAIVYVWQTASGRPLSWRDWGFRIFALVSILPGWFGGLSILGERGTLGAALFLYVPVLLQLCFRWPVVGEIWLVLWGLVSAAGMSCFGATQTTWGSGSALLGLGLIVTAEPMMVLLAPICKGPYAFPIVRLGIGVVGGGVLAGIVSSQTPASEYGGLLEFAVLPVLVGLLVSSVGFVLAMDRRNQPSY